MKKSYVKPYLEEVSMIGRDLVADNPCMAQTSHGKLDYYYDWPGDGWVVIHMAAQNCSGEGNIGSITWHDNPKIDGEQSTEIQNEAIAYVRTLISSNKQQFASILEPEPGPSWS